LVQGALYYRNVSTQSVEEQAKMPATIRDIAKQLNLSVSTVSYALNNGPKPVSEEVRGDVLRVAQELGYRPNRIARSLVTRQSKVIGVVMPLVEPDPLKTPFVQLALNTIINAAEHSGYDLMLSTGRERSSLDGVEELLQDSRIDGVIMLAPPENREVIAILRAHSMPFAVVAGGDDEVGPFYRADDAHGTWLAMDHLWSQGHRRIAHVAGRANQYDARIRQATYETYMRDRKQPILPGYILNANYTRAKAEPLLDPLMNLPEPPTAVFCANDEMAVGLLIAARRRGIRVPEDLSLIGFDDTTPAEACDPPLSSVRQPIETMTAAAFADVLNQLGGRRPGTGTIFPTTLTVRRSTAIPKEESLLC
jgi:DNA-binding LacI/PurR family transcriptional regulator